MVEAEGAEGAEPAGPWREATAAGQTFRFLDSGEGPLVVLLHGFPDLPTGWDAVRARLNAEGYRTVAPYLRGYHPATQVPGRSYQAHDTAEDVTRLLDALEVDRAVVVGHDWGASLTYTVATLFPERVVKMAALGIPHPVTLKPSPRLAVFARHFLWFNLPFAAQAARRGGLRMVGRFYRRLSPHWRDQGRDASVAAVQAAFADPRVLDGAIAYYRAQRPGSAPLRGRIGVPGLVVGGEDERALREGYEATPSRFSAPCEVHVLRGVGHWPHREDPETFLALLVPFLAS